MDTYKAPTTRALTLPELTQREQAAYAGWVTFNWDRMNDILRRYPLPPAVGQGRALMATVVSEPVW